MADGPVAGPSPLPNATETTITGHEPATPAARLAWMLFDWAAQPFATLITTFVFAPYFAAHVAASPVQGQAIWGWAAGTAGLVIALCSPLCGAMGDAVGPRKPWIAGFSLLGVVGSAMLWFAIPGGQFAIGIGVVGFVVATIGFEIAAVFNNAMMPNLVPRSRLGALSGSGWALGYVGGIVCLILVLGFVTVNPSTGRTLVGLEPILGLDPQTHAGDRATGPFTAIWYLVFVAPLFLLVPDFPGRADSRRLLRHSLAALVEKLKALPRRRSYFAFLAASMLYRDGLNAVFVFGGIYAAGVLSMSAIQIGLFGILATVTGAAGAWASGRLDPHWGPVRMVAISCVVVIAATIVVVSTTSQTALFVLALPPQSDVPLVVFYAAGGFIGAASGALQAASRTLLVDQVEPEETAEAFGMYALSGRATSFIGPYLVGIVTTATASQRLGVTPLIVLLALGAIGLIWVRSAPPAHLP